MKKRTILILSGVLAIALAAGFLVSPRRRTMRWYDRHIAELKEDVRRHFEGGEPLTAPAGATVNRWPGEHAVVEYLVVGGGLVPSARYYGVFYSPDDVPVSFQNAGEGLTGLSSAQWEWRGAGDDRGLVRRIEPGWFYFEARF